MIVGAVLAAGAGTRMGGPKAELVVGGVRLVDRAVSALRDGGCDHVVAVVRDGIDVAQAQVVVNAEPDRGMRSSLQLAVDAVLNATVFVVVLADMPGIGAAAVRAVVGAWHPGRIAAGLLDGRPGHPVAMSPELWRAALEVAGVDEGARRLMAARPDLVDAVSIPGDPTDLDSPADLPGL